MGTGEAGGPSVAKDAGKSVTFWLRPLYYPSIHPRPVCLALNRLGNTNLHGTEFEKNFLCMSVSFTLHERD